MSYDEIVRLEKKLNDINNQIGIDTTAIADELFDDKVMIVGRTGETVDKQLILQMHTANGKAYTKVIVDKLEITVFESSAIVHSLNTHYPVAAQTFQILFLRVWAKKDDKWRIVGGSATAVNKS